MSNAEEVWRRKSDDQVIDAASRLSEYTDEGQRIILSEAKRRGLSVAPLLETVARIEAQAAQPRAKGLCAYCGTYILFGGIGEGNARFCNERCRSEGILIGVSRQVPDQIVAEYVRRLHEGACPVCGGPGPVDFRISHRIWSALIVSSSSNRPRLTCRQCGIRANVKDGLFSLAFGWWGLPWGIIMTPIQVGRNVVRVLRPTDDSRPSPELERMVRLRLAADLVGGTAHAASVDTSTGAGRTPPR